MTGCHHRRHEEPAELPSSHPRPRSQKCTNVMSAVDLGSQCLSSHSWGGTCETQPRCCTRTDEGVCQESVLIHIPSPASQLQTDRRLCGARTHPSNHPWTRLRLEPLHQRAGVGRGLRGLWSVPLGQTGKWSPREGKWMPKVTQQMKTATSCQVSVEPEAEGGNQ